MGKRKIKMQKIEKDSNRRVTFNKRRIGLLKKAYEISILCDVDIALMLFAQNSELTCYEGPRSSIEEVVMKFASISENERAKSHVCKYTTSEDLLRNTMPREIENEEMLHKAARDLYHSVRTSQTPSKYDGSHQMELCPLSFLQGAIKEIRQIKNLLSVYDLNKSINELIFSNKDSFCMESYVRRQLERIEESKQIQQVADSLHLSWSNNQNIDRGFQADECTNINQKLPTSGQTSIGWDVLAADLGLFCDLTNNDEVEHLETSSFFPQSPADQLEPRVLSQLLEGAFEHVPLSIDTDIDTHDILEGVHAEESFENFGTSNL